MDLLNISRVLCIVDFFYLFAYSPYEATLYYPTGLPSGGFSLPVGGLVCHTLADKDKDQLGGAGYMVEGVVVDL